MDATIAAVKVGERRHVEHIDTNQPNPKRTKRSKRSKWSGRRTGQYLCKKLMVNQQTRDIIRQIKGMRTEPGISTTTISVMSKTRYVPLSDDWFKMRGKLLTASDMAAVLGENIYCTRDQLFKRKTRQGPGFNGNAATRWGQKYEDEAALVYSSITGLDLVNEPIGMLIHSYEKDNDGRKRYAATPDFMTLNGIMIEIKCPYRRTITHDIPKYYMAQVQMQLEVTGASMAHFVQYRPPSDDEYSIDGVLDIRPIARDPDWWREARPLFDDFWDSVISWHTKRGLELGDAPQSTVPETRTKKTKGHVQSRCNIVIKKI